MPHSDLDPMQPTVVFHPSSSPSEPNSLDVSRAHVGFVAGDRPLFADETAELLRSRLFAATWVMAVVLGAAFLGNLLSGTASLWWLRALILLLLSGIATSLARTNSLTLKSLRMLELIVFGLVVLQLSLMLLTRLAEFATKNDATSLISVEQQFLMAWCVLIFIYGILMPNTWKRGAVVMISAALIPYGLVFVQSWLSPAVGTLLSLNKARAPLPMPLVAAFVTTFATHVINAARREAFKARQFGQYRLMERLGAGGMGEVYKAEHVLLKRPCAIKLIKASNDADVSAIAWFEKEVKTTAKLTHWNTIEIYDYGRTDDGTFYYVMELLPGMSLEDLVEKYGPMPPERVVYLLKQICGALHEAHSVGLIHRDIKPANIFVSQRGGVFDVAKLLDFGLVKEGKGQSDAGVKSGSFSGTPLYMSPEQASAYDEVDGRADIYSLGAMAYYLLTGRPPFTGKNIIELLAAHREADVTPPSQLDSKLSSDLDDILLKCLAKNPSDRYQSADELRKRLEQTSVSAGWGPDQAEQWWLLHRGSAQQDNRPEAADEATVTEVTVIDQSQHG